MIDKLSICVGFITHKLPQVLYSCVPIMLWTAYSYCMTVIPYIRLSDVEILPCTKVTHSQTERRLQCHSVGIGLGI